MDLLSFVKLKAQSFVDSNTHSWNVKPSRLQALVFILKLVEWYIANPDTRFVVSGTTFSDLRKLEDNTLVRMKELLMKNLDFSELRCWYTDDKLTLVSCSGSNMLLIDQGNPTLGADEEGQKWHKTTWFFNSFKKI